MDIYSIFIVVGLTGGVTFIAVIITGLIQAIVEKCGWSKINLTERELENVFNAHKTDNQTDKEIEEILSKRCLTAKRWSVDKTTGILKFKN
jgi:hypothetical protein